MYDDIRRESSGAYPAGGELGGTIREVKHRGGDAYNATFVLRAIVARRQESSLSADHRDWL